MQHTPLDPQRAEMMRARFEEAPFNSKLAVRGDKFELGRAVLSIDYAEENTTVVDIVHGGAIAGLIDCAATAAAWTTVEDTAPMRGITIGLVVNYVAAARSTAIYADARIVRQGRSITHVDCVVRDDGDSIVATSSVIYKLSGFPDHGAPKE